VVAIDFCGRSALTKQGTYLIEMLLAPAGFASNSKPIPTAAAKGNVIESGLEPGGPTATVLVRKGTLPRREVMICGPYYAGRRSSTREQCVSRKRRRPWPSSSRPERRSRGAGLNSAFSRTKKPLVISPSSARMEARALGHEANRPK